MQIKKLIQNPIIWLIVWSVLIMTGLYAMQMLAVLHKYNDKAIEAHFTLTSNKALTTKERNYLEEGIGMAQYMNKAHAYVLYLAIMCFAWFFLGIYSVYNPFGKWVNSQKRFIQKENSSGKLQI